MATKKGFINSIEDKPVWVKACIVGVIIIGLATIFGVTTAIAGNLSHQESAAAVKQEVEDEKMRKQYAAAYDKGYSMYIAGFAESAKDVTPFIAEHQEEFKQIVDLIKVDNGVAAVSKEINLEAIDPNQGTRLEDYTPETEVSYKEQGVIHITEKHDFENILSTIETFYTDKGYVLDDKQDIEEIPEYKMFYASKVNSKDAGLTTVMILPNDSDEMTVAVTYSSAALPLKVLPKLDGFKTNEDAYKLSETETDNSLAVCPSPNIDGSVRNFWFPEFGCLPEEEHEH